ncbi:MAG: hypothetical protein ABIK65_15435 [Candidatus Eisenbacteria bacterium]
MIRATLLLLLIPALIPSLTHADEGTTPTERLAHPGSDASEGDVHRSGREHVFSVAIMIGSGSRDFSTAEATADGIESIKTVFDEFADEFEDATGIMIRWSDEGFSEQKRAYEIGVDFRLNFPAESTPIFLGRGTRLGFEAGFWRLRSSSLLETEGVELSLSEPGFGAVVSEKALGADGTFLVYLPRSLFDRDIPLLGRRRDVYFGAGGGMARGRHGIEIFHPPFDFQGVGELLVVEADQWTRSFHAAIGGEEFFSQWISLSWEIGWSTLVFDNLKWTDASLAAFAAKEESGGAPISGWDETGGVATVWDDWTPPGEMLGSWVADPDRPIEIDLSGFNFRLGLRAHFF